ncbi:hypothetical protein RHMOL_Rhmol09G0192600 [Rhododendron molle]|uniref:Uncharacterized protein n=1 Tax=Rhododendron molle TaxID=49168 RepID=A0ACC0MGV8_RHOML|nr:hypothetical protein RHMOL_Rhmol09G0192600 [Rhododendron molle]
MGFGDLFGRVIALFSALCHDLCQLRDFLDRVSAPIWLVCMESATDLVEYNYEGLASITAGFSKENFIGDTLFGKVFRGKIQQDLETQKVVVKIWVKTTSFASTPDRQKSRLDNEIKLLTNSDLKGHPNLVKLIGFFCETEHLGVVYELKPLDTLEKLILHDDFTWVAQIKVALEFACLLECLHDQQLLHRSISAAHLMVDQALSPRLFDFAMLVGGGVGEIRSREHAFGSHGYVDPLISLTDMDRHLQALLPEICFFTHSPHDGVMCSEVKF